VHHPDEERARREDSAAYVHVCVVMTCVYVPSTAVRVLASFADAHHSPAPHHRAQTEDDEHDAYAHLESICESRRHLRVQKCEHAADQEKRKRMAHAPERAEQRASARAWLLRRQRRNGRHVIRFERMAHSK